jgi:hypothetical protein
MGLKQTIKPGALNNERIVGFLAAAIPAPAVRVKLPAK